MKLLKKYTLNTLLAIAAYTPVIAFYLKSFAIYYYWKYPEQYFEWYRGAASWAGNGLLWLAVYFFAYYRGHYKFCKYTLIALYGLLTYNIINVIDYHFGLCLLDYLTFFWMVGFGGAALTITYFILQQGYNYVFKS